MLRCCFSLKLIFYFVHTFRGNSMSFYAFSSVLNYLDLHASSAPLNIFLCFLRFLFGLGCLWLNGISHSIAYNWSRPNMKISVRIIHASSYYRNVPVSRKGFSLFPVMHVCFIDICFYLEGFNFICCYVCFLLNNSFFFLLIFQFCF